MKPDAVIAALSALAQENRLAVFRALVQAGHEGLCPSDLADKSGVVGTTLSFHLAQLRHAGLISFAMAVRWSMRNRLPDPSDICALLDSKENFADSESARFQRLSASIGRIFF